MGWKSVKEAYRIGHIVKVVGDEIHIGSPYVGDLIRIDQSGKVTLNRVFDRRGDLGRYMDEMERDPARLLALIRAEDQFGPTTTVYTWSDGHIIEKQCEETGWPNVTTDGQLMHDNTFSTSVETTVARARADHDAWAARAADRVVEIEESLAQARRRHQDALDAIARLDASHPRPSKDGVERQRNQ